jgi:hypothetical protein
LGIELFLWHHPLTLFDLIIFFEGVVLFFYAGEGGGQMGGGAGYSSVILLPFFKSAFLYVPPTFSWL